MLFTNGAADLVQRYFVFRSPASLYFDSRRVVSRSGNEGVVSADNKIFHRLFQHKNITGRYIGWDSAAGHQDIAARGLTALGQSCHAQAVDFIGLAHMDNRRLDVAGDDTITAEEFDGRFDGHFMTETDDARITHGNFAPQGQILVLFPADVTVDVSNSRLKDFFMQFFLVGQHKGFKKPGGEHLVRSRGRSQIGQHILGRKGGRKQTHHRHTVGGGQPQQPVGQIGLFDHPAHQKLGAAQTAGAFDG